MGFLSGGLHFGTSAGVEIQKVRFHAVAEDNATGWHQGLE